MLSLRRVNSSDCRLLFEWANDLDVRANAISQDPIVWESHINWFSQKIKSPNTWMFIMEKKGKAVGQIRYDKEDGFYLIDYSISKENRGKGYGKEILKKTLSFFRDMPVRALVKSVNFSSAHIFRQLGFTEKLSVSIDEEHYFVFEI